MSSISVSAISLVFLVLMAAECLLRRQSRTIDVEYFRLGPSRLVGEWLVRRMRTTIVRHLRQLVVSEIILIPGMERISRGFLLYQVQFWLRDGGIGGLDGVLECLPLQVVSSAISLVSHNTQYPDVSSGRKGIWNWWSILYIFYICQLKNTSSMCS